MLGRRQTPEPAPTQTEAPAEKLTIISGLGRCGTSFAAACFRRAGIDPGGGWGSDVRAGWEYASVVAVNDAMRSAVGDMVAADVASRAACAWRERMAAAIDGKRVVKDPRFFYLARIWFETGLVGRAIQMVRDVEECIASANAALPPMERTPPPLNERLGYFVNACDLYAIPRVTIRFPDVVLEEGRDFETLAAEIQRMGVSREQAEAAIRETRDPSLVRHSPGR